MLIVDQVKTEDRAIRMVGIGMLLGLVILLGGLWYLQVISFKRYARSARTQSIRSVRFPAVRGKILDSQGQVLAESRPSYNIVLYLNELSPLFKQEFKRVKGNRRLSSAAADILACQARYTVASNAVQQLGLVLGQPFLLDEAKFTKHYLQRRALPLPILENVSPTNIAMFLEQPNHPPGFDLEIQPLRSYPYHSLAAHLLGYIRRDETEGDDEESFFTYRLPDFRGLSGVEGAFDVDLRGKSGAKSVVVNNLGYRQSENIWLPAEPGKNVVLTIDARIQQVAEQALHSVRISDKGAVVVMNPQNGDILAMASSPTYDPNILVPRVSVEDWQVLNDTNRLPLISRATYGSYQPGSIFKIVVALAGLEAGTLDPKAKLRTQKHFRLGKQLFEDLANPGDYDFVTAFKASSNYYFIYFGLQAGLHALMDMGSRFHLGERTALPVIQEVGGRFPTDALLKQQRSLGSPWQEGDTANLCLGQGYINVTPLQMAMMTSAIANGGKIFWPRLVQRIEAQDSIGSDGVQSFAAGQLRSELSVARPHLDLIRAAMLADVEDAGTGKRAWVEGMHICGKTGTAEVKDLKGVLQRHDVWFVSFAPYENPRYAIVVMVEHGDFGGTTSAPVAQQIYQALKKMEASSPPKATLITAHSASR
jgi:penicillin-binding protein 2